VDNQPITLAYHIITNSNWSEISKIALPATGGEVQEITIPLSSDISKWESSYGKMKAIDRIAFSINPKEKFKGTLILQSLTLE
jgi:hypothetical protein